MRSSLRFYLVFSLLLASCAAKTPYILVDDYSKRGIRQIAVMPPVGQVTETKPVQMLREKLSDGLYFKGYGRIAPAAIEAALANLKDAGPRELGKVLGVDALLYTNIKELSAQGGVLYAPVAVEAEFELRSATSGESLWSVRRRVVRMNYGLSRRAVELKSAKVFEDALQELVEGVLETLPDGL